jgi:hypothetical protein
MRLVSKQIKDQRGKMARKKSPDEETAVADGNEKVKFKLRPRKDVSGNGDATDDAVEPVAAPAASAPARPLSNVLNPNGRKMEISEFKNKNMNELVEMALSGWVLRIRQTSKNQH